MRGRKATKKIRRKVGRGGRFEFKFKVGNPGTVRLVVKHAASPGQAAFRAQDRRITVVDWQAGAGERGLKVLLLQRALVKEGFATPVTGYYDDGTARAVLAFRKTNELGRDGYAIKPVFAMLARGQGAFKLRYPKAGKHVEFDWSRQVLVLANGAKPYRTYHTSSGTPATPDGVRQPTASTCRRRARTRRAWSTRRTSSAATRSTATRRCRPTRPATAACGCRSPTRRQIFSWIDIGDPIFTYR